MVGASHRNWKDIANRNKDIAENAQSLLNAAKESQTKKDKQLQAEAVSRQLQIAQLQSQREIEKLNRDAKEKELAEQLVISQERLQRMSIASDRVKQQDEEIRTLQNDRKLLIDEVSQKRTEVVTLTTQILELKTTLEQMEVTTKDLSAQLARKDKVLKNSGLTEESLTDSIEPKVEAVVMKVQDDLIVISIGTDDGVREGHTLDIHRGDRFVGKCVVSKADFNLAAARVLPEFRQMVVREGDHVTTKF